MIEMHYLHITLHYKCTISVLQSVGVAHAHGKTKPEPGEGLQNQVWSGVRCGHRSVTNNDHECGSGNPSLPGSYSLQALGNFGSGSSIKSGLLAHLCHWIWI